MNINKAILLGNLGADPEIRTTREGKEVASLQLATNEHFTDKAGERQTRTDWHTVIVFAPGLIEKVIKPYLKRGSSVFVEGSISARSYEDKAKNKRTAVEIVAERLRLGSRKGDETATNAN